MMNDPQNQRMKHRYALWRREANRADIKTVDKELAAVLRFEKSTGFRSFKLFRIEQAVAFKRGLEVEINPATKRPLAKSTIDSLLRGAKAFFSWLADQPGYRSRIKHSDVAYFNLNAKDARVAHTHREPPFPTLDQCRHAFCQMPEDTAIARRNKALFAFQMMTAARIGAVASLRCRHIDLVEGCVHQDAREVRTKGAKTFTTWFFPVEPIYTDFFRGWVVYLRETLLFGPADPLFPPQKIGYVDGSFAPTGFCREPYSGATQLRAAIGNAFVAAGLPRFHPHGFRKMLVKLGNDTCRTPEEFKAWSLNIGHDSILTTTSAYLPVSATRQRELLNAMRARQG